MCNIKLYLFGESYDGAVFLVFARSKQKLISRHFPQRVSDLNKPNHNLFYCIQYVSVKNSGSDETAASEISDPGFPFLAPSLQLCQYVDTNGSDDFDCDADWQSYFQRNRPYFQTTKRDAVSSEKTMTTSVSLKSSLKPRRIRDGDRDRLMKLDELRVLNLELMVRLLLR